MIYADVEQVVFINPQEDERGVGRFFAQNTHGAAGGGGDDPPYHLSKPQVAFPSSVGVVPKSGEYQTMLANMARDRATAERLVAQVESNDHIWYRGTQPWSDEKREAAVTETLARVMYLENGASVYRNSNLAQETLESMDKLRASRVAYYASIERNGKSPAVVKDFATRELLKMEAEHDPHALMRTNWALKARAKDLAENMDDAHNEICVASAQAEPAQVEIDEWLVQSAKFVW